ncbi:MAG: hypothetical protein K2O14_07465 [Oscillospiraceae bacterium]|nr:hypothetical protein [Oscillospiraceae bacterium]
MSFKDQLAADVKNVFLNTNEFAETHNVKYDGVLYENIKEIAEYILNHEDVVQTLNDAIGSKVDKEEGKGLSAEDFTAALKAKLEALPEITSADIEKWNAGIISEEEKERLTNLRGVRYGTEPPEDMKNGELFVRVVSES